MNLTPHGRLGWSWMHAGLIWHTDHYGKGLYCGRVLLDSEFVAPRDRVKMLRMIKERI